ncbi:MAG: hypothetical protein ACLVCQ_08165, partial [Subdoligranulum sp.]
MRSFNASDMADSPFLYGVFLSQSGKRSPLPSMQAPFILHRQTQYKSIIHQMLEKTNLFLLKATPHNSKCRYGERGAADAKPKAQIILDAA